MPRRFEAGEQINAEANLVESFIDSGKIILTDSIIFTQGKLVSTAEQGVYFTERETLFLTQGPRSEFDANTLTGDSVFVHFRDRSP